MRAQVRRLPEGSLGATVDLECGGMGAGGTSARGAPDGPGGFCACRNGWSGFGCDVPPASCAALPAHLPSGLYAVGTDKDSVRCGY